MPPRMSFLSKQNTANTVKKTFQKDAKYHNSCEQQQQYNFIALEISTFTSES